MSFLISVLPLFLILKIDFFSYGMHPYHSFFFVDFSHHLAKSNLPEIHSAFKKEQASKSTAKYDKSRYNKTRPKALILRLGKVSSQALCRERLKIVCLHRVPPLRDGGTPWENWRKECGSQQRSDYQENMVH